VSLTQVRRRDDRRGAGITQNLRDGLNARQARKLADFGIGRAEAGADKQMAGIVEAHGRGGGVGERRHRG
jgi:hypothetical protein